MAIQRWEEQVSCDPKRGVHDSHGGSCSCEGPSNVEDAIAEAIERLHKRVAADKAALECREKHKAKIDWGLPDE